jgi:hypothetical protein
MIVPPTLPQVVGCTVEVLVTQPVRNAFAVFRLSPSNRSNRTCR